MYKFIKTQRCGGVYSMEVKTCDFGFKKNNYNNLVSITQTDKNSE